MAMDANLAPNAWLVRARSWLVIAAVAGVALAPLAYLGRLAVRIGTPASPFVEALPNVLLLAATVALVRGVAPGPAKQLALSAAAARAVHVGAVVNP